MFGASPSQILRHIVLPVIRPGMATVGIGMGKGLYDWIKASFHKGYQTKNGVFTSADFNYTPLVIAAVLFIAITIPQARFTDWLIARDRRRQLAAG